MRTARKFTHATPAQTVIAPVVSLPALLRLPEVMQITGYRKSSIYELMAKGLFPQNIRLAGGGLVAWRGSDIAAWIDAQGAPKP